MSKKLPLKHYSVSELAKIYGVCDRTFKKWIKPFESEIGERRGRYYNANQVKTIFQKLEIPNGYELE